jgi:hypothetical protein
MNLRWPLALVFLVIFVLQAALLTVGYDWFPDILARVAASRPNAHGAEWDLLVSLMALSPVLLLVAPYAIAVSAWRSLLTQGWQFAS